MSIIFHSDCPHCGKNEVQFMGVAVAPNREGPNGLPTDNVFLTCNHCANPVSLVVEYRKRPPWTVEESMFNVIIPPLGNHSKNQTFRAVSMYPVPQSPVAPESTPDPIARTFIEARDNLKRGNLETCEMLCRKVLDVATKRLKPNIDTFYARIDALCADGTITPAMSEWAHIVRQDGNASAHTEAPTTEEAARELTGFAEMFLIYAFSLPAMVEARRLKPPP